MITPLLTASQALAALIAIVGGTVHPGNGPAVENATVIIDGQKIQAVGAGLAVPAGATVIDAKGKIVTPGLFDPYTRLGLVEIEQIDDTNDVDAGGDPIRAAQRATDSYNPDSQVIAVQAAHGITTVLAAPGGGLISGQAAIFDLNHEATDTGLAAAAVGQPVSIGGAGGTSRGALLLTLREVLDDAAQYAKNRAAWEKGQFRDFAGGASRLDLEALQPVLAGKEPLLVTVHRRSDILAVLDLAAELKIKVVLVGAAEAWQVAARLAKEKIPVIIDPVENAPESFDMLGARADAAALLEKAGVPVMLSTFSSHNVRKLRQWAGNAVREGMTHAGALTSITARPAEVFGLKDHGTLAAGQVANVVVWSGDPFETTTIAERVFVRGAPSGDDHRQKRLLNRYRSLPPVKKP
jgi:imidazolonepropionase-like amidohydrolase